MCSSDLNFLAGAGGNGTASPYSGTPVTYAGGGGGARNSNLSVPGGSGGSGGGGAGSNDTYSPTPGSTNTGGGGGGDGTQVKGGNGGKGIVIVRYSGSQAATGGTVTTSPGYTIHTFTGDGTFRSNTVNYQIN